jgi:hypothetical protein
MDKENIRPSVVSANGNGLQRMPLVSLGKRVQPPSPVKPLSNSGSGMSYDHLMAKMAANKAAASSSVATLDKKQRTAPPTTTTTAAASTNQKKLASTTGAGAAIDGIVDWKAAYDLKVTSSVCGSMHSLTNHSITHTHWWPCYIVVGASINR